MTDAHASEKLIAQYVRADPACGAEGEWAVEAHLETCALCRARLAAALDTHAPADTVLLDAVWTDIAAGLDTEAVPHRARSRLLRWAHTWAAPSLLPWLAMTALVIGAAFVLGQAAGTHLPSLVLLLAPVAPLLGVAAAWSRRVDPMHELIAATPRSGLRMVLRRTVAVLVVVIPLLAVAGGFADVSPALWLLPCLACTVGTLALGTVLGLARAALLLASAWAAVAVAPSLLTHQLSPLLAPLSLPAWAALAIAAAIVLRLRAPAYRQLGSQR